MKKATANTAVEILVDETIRKLAWRAVIRARALRAEARTRWQEKKIAAQLKFQAAQFDDLAQLLKELQAPDDVTATLAGVLKGETHVERSNSKTGVQNNERS